MSKRFLPQHVRCPDWLILRQPLHTRNTSPTFLPLLYQCGVHARPHSGQLPHLNRLRSGARFGTLLSVSTAVCVASSAHCFCQEAMFLSMARSTISSSSMKGVCSGSGGACRAPKDMFLSIYADLQEKTRNLSQQ